MRFVWKDLLLLAWKFREALAVFEINGCYYLINSTYIWLPVRFKENGEIEIPFVPEWRPREGKK